MKKFAFVIAVIAAILLRSVSGFAEGSEVHTPGTVTYTLKDLSLTLNDKYFSVDQNPGSAMTVKDSDNILTAVIKCNVLDGDSLKKLRQNYNDFSSTDDEIFGKYIGYFKTYLPALQESYRAKYLYDSGPKDFAESNMKIFKEEQDEKLFGQEAYGVLYNTVLSDKSGSVEEVHINFVVPLVSRRSVYFINFILPKAFPAEASLAKISSLFESVRIADLPLQTGLPEVLKDEKAVEAARLGIYPDPGQGEIFYTDFINKDSGYRLTLPSSFMPYRENHIVDSFDFTSFKINYNHYFSISSESITEEASAIDDKIRTIKDLHHENMEDMREGLIEIAGKEFQYIKYTLPDKDKTSYLQDFFTINNSRLYHLQLNSSFIEPSEQILNEFMKIAASLEFIEDKRMTAGPRDVLTQFTNKEEGYTFSYPESWKLTENVSPDVNYDMFLLKNPDFSAPLDVFINEGELSADASTADVLEYLTGSDSEKVQKSIKKYTVPYQERSSKVLTVNYKIEDDIIYMYKLVNYLDANDRNRLCYAQDIIRGSRICSMFVSVSDYAVVDGKIVNEDIDRAVNVICNSFTFEETEEYLARAAKGETRNRKVVFIEDFFKRLYGETARIITALNDGSPEDVMVTLEGVPESGYYKLNLDYENRQVQITGSTLIKDILDKAAKELGERYSEKIIEDLRQDLENMTVEIVFSDDLSSPYVTRTYKVNTFIKDREPAWELVRENHASALRDDAVNFISSIFTRANNIKISSETDFSDIDNYQRKGKNYFSLLYADLENESGYFLLDINPFNDKITLVSYTPLDVVYNGIKKRYPTAEGNKSINLGIDDEDKFKIYISHYSGKDNGFTAVVKRIVLNPSSHKLEFK